ncbi:Lactonase, 7-bladed beta-propeller-domain-containing protein [Talaromyces proteolyticus]|uniref:Lactonase, 7-bladed beta-propeller-domain-containing protein n=1 Tax=Talaromyces proteolyticus TaxID=1131652 RepID=A0AAD4KS93_9EURO|nr:Lactonase, 7-bladed beta-propeller-domain-containing protein [Talaromyces proteolyticus]KAH8698006.1 Lactonase, 7-bladed beta-propeller-domain-containing protein [Talaromyces proteolyticus]
MFAAASALSTLFVSHYDGHVFTLNLNASGGHLIQSNSLQACGSMPSWLTYDAATAMLYCVDESGSSANSGNGTLSSFVVDTRNKGSSALTKEATTETLPGGVASVIYEGDCHRRYLAIAHYEGSAVSTFQLPLTPRSTALQTFEYVLTEPATDPSRQDAPHPHEVFLDPTGAYVLAPDLGMDIIHIYAIDKATGKLHECSQFKVKGGNGPRHGAWTTGSNSEKSAILYISNELANTVGIYTATYSEGCLALRDAGEVTPYPKDVPNTATIAEIRIVGGKDIYVSVRNDQAFPPNDSIAFLETSRTDDATYKTLTSSYGKTPRTCVINKAGTLLAIGNQASSDVAIVERDPKSGALGKLVAQLQVGNPGLSNGLSSVVWAE